MRTSNALRITPPTPDSEYEQTQPPARESQVASKRAEPRLVRPGANGGNGHHTEEPLRMYTEEQVAEMLQVSLSQLRKWRMKQYEGQRQGPPFRKIGRLVRYPEAALRDYINSSQSDPAA